jgi:hypothetical protein
MTLMHLLPSQPADVFLGAGAPGGAHNFPCARTLSGMSVDLMLDLMDWYEEVAEEHLHQMERARATLLRIGHVLAHRLGVTCEEYIAIMCANSTAQDWRTLLHCTAQPLGHPAVELR